MHKQAFNTRIDQALTKLVEIKNACRKDNKAENVDQRNAGGKTGKPEPFAFCQSRFGLAIVIRSKAIIKLIGLGVVQSLNLLLFLEAVTDTIKRLDAIKSFVHLAKLFAKTFDVAVDGAVIHIDLIIISRIH